MSNGASNQNNPRSSRRHQGLHHENTKIRTVNEKHKLHCSSTIAEPIPFFHTYTDQPPPQLSRDNDQHAGGSQFRGRERSPTPFQHWQERVSPTIQYFQAPYLYRSRRETPTNRGGFGIPQERLLQAHLSTQAGTALER